ncbi:hypothetical protein [Pedobacter sp. UBA4863]|uniref:hypothetical protein n=1 Tax=Pedobacter sp. UBA4863 TaxID=1947060 RepID=UPI0025E7C1D6|nr:hypothetical protein [Pedobacter sp. UBA4863]
MSQIPPITDAYIDEVIKSMGPYVESINKTQGIKLRELIKLLRDYFEQEIPTNTSQLINDSNYVTSSLINGLPEESGSKRPFIMRSLANYNPDEIFGTGAQPLHVMLVATELVADKETVTQLKISDGVTAFKDLKNLIVDGVINGGSNGQTLEKQSILDGDASWVDIPQKIADVLALKLNTADYNQHFRGKFASLIALESTTFNPPLQVGDYAQVDPGQGTDVKNYNWDADDNSWIEGGSVSAATNTDQLPEGTANLYFTSSRAVDAVSNDYIHKSGNVNENISGKKSFQQAPTLNSLTGNRILSLSATKEIESFYEVTLPIITNATIITQLTAAGNWNASDVYIGSTITGAYQMQFYADANYWYYFYNDNTPLRIPRRAAQLAATDAEAVGGSLANKFITPANWAYMKSINQSVGTWQFNGVGLGIAGSSTAAYLTFLANTTSRPLMQLTQSAVDYTGTTNGMFWNNGGELKFVDNSIVNRVLKVYNNELFKSDGNYLATFNQYGDLSATIVVKEKWIYDSDVINALEGATWATDRETITPANGKVMYKGQKYDDGTYSYEAYDDNKVRRW